MDTNVVYRTYNGTDTTVLMGIAGNEYVINNYITTISISTTITMIPINVLGSKEAQEYVLGSKTIAGTIVFTEPAHGNVFDGVFGEETAENKLAEQAQYEQLPELNIFLITKPEEITISTSKDEVIKIKRSVLQGVRFRDSGKTISSHDMYTELVLTYTARSFFDFPQGGKVPGNDRTFGMEKIELCSKAQLIQAKLFGNNKE